MTMVSQGIVTLCKKLIGPISHLWKNDLNKLERKVTKSEIEIQQALEEEKGRKSLPSKLSKKEGARKIENYQEEK